MRVRYIHLCQAIRCWNASWCLVRSIQWFHMNLYWYAVLNCAEGLGSFLWLHHHHLHLPIWQSGHNHIMWMVDDTFCRNVNIVAYVADDMYRCEPISNLQEHEVPTSHPDCYFLTFLTGSCWGWHVCFLVKYLHNYWLDCNDIWHTLSNRTKNCSKVGGILTFIKFHQQLHLENVLLMSEICAKNKTFPSAVSLVLISKW